MADNTKVIAGIALLGGALYLMTKKAGAEPPPPPPPGKANLYGKVSDSAGGVAGVSILMGAYSATTDASGNYEILDVELGSYGLFFSKTGYNNKEVTMNLIEGNNTLNVSRVATLEGIVSDSVGPLQGVLVTIGGITDVTDSTGYYGFNGLTPGNYAITFSKSGYTTVTR